MTAPVARTTPWFIDEIEDGVARLLCGEEVLSLPVSALPEGAHEGAWVAMSVGLIPPPPQDTEARREHLVASDPGGPIKL